jgi:hypothetical protein
VAVNLWGGGGNEDEAARVAGVGGRGGFVARQWATGPAGCCCGWRGGGGLDSTMG